MLGLLHGKDTPRSCRKRANCIVALRYEGILIEDGDELTYGWRLLDQDGVNLQPGPPNDLLWADERWGWTYWRALGRPHRARLYSIIDPVRFDEISDDDGDDDRPRFEVIRGGKAT